MTFGPRSSVALSTVIRRRGAKRVFVVADQVLRNAGVVPIIETTINELTDAEYRIYDEGEIEPSTASVRTATESAKEFGADLLVGLGGGSNMDLAKVCRVAMTHEGDPFAWFGFDKVPCASPGEVPPLVCLPTTAGTGSEVSHSAVLRNSDTGNKGAILSQRIRPDIAIVDPYLSVTCPQRVTAESGLDALTHAIEAWTVTNFYAFDEQPGDALPYEGNNPLGDIYAEKAIRLIGKNLLRAFEEPEDLAARSGMSLAATLAGAAFANCGVGLAHALEYPIGQKANCTHGVGNAIVLPEVMRYLKQHRANRLAQVGEFLHDGPLELSRDEMADWAIQRVAELRAATGLPNRLQEVGIEENDLESLATKACSLQRLVDLTPGTPATGDALAILRACY